MTPIAKIITMKSFLSALLIFTVSISSNAQKLANSTLWKIEGNGLTEASYLFGTMHLTCDANLDDRVLNALENTDQLVLELDMDDPQMQANMMGGMMMNDGITASDLISEEDYKLLDEFLTKELGMGLSAGMNQMKPFFIQASLYPKLVDCSLESFEMELMNVTNSQGEETHGLETVEEQLKVFDNIPYRDQIEDLVKMAKNNMDYDKKTMAKMMDMYESENIEGMLDMMNDDYYSSVSNHQDLLLSKRNKNWIEKIESYAKKTPTFFGVGAGHLAGKDGVILLLRAKGYTVTPVL